MLRLCVVVLLTNDTTTLSRFNRTIGIGRRRSMGRGGCDTRMIMTATCIVIITIIIIVVHIGMMICGGRVAIGRRIRCLRLRISFVVFRVGGRFGVRIGFIQTGFDGNVDRCGMSFKYRYLTIL